MSKIENDYLNLLKEILETGTKKEARNGVTYSVFGKTLRHSFENGNFPLLTTKKMAFKSIVTELLWFLKGEVNIKYLIDNNCHIWDGDAWVNYQRKVSDKFMDETIIANYSITNKEDFINRIKTDDEFANKWGYLGPIYGHQWRHWNVLKWHKTDMPDPIISGETLFKWSVEGVDQIQNVINELRVNPDSRRLVVSAWNVGELDEMILMPCHYSFQFHTKEIPESERLKLYLLQTDNKIPIQSSGLSDFLDESNIPRRKLSLMYNARSQDVPLGTPFNIASYGLLLLITSKMVNMVPDELIASMGDSHIYGNQKEAVLEQIKREPKSLPKINFSDKINFMGTIDDFINSCDISDIKLEGYNSHDKIYFPLSN